MLKKLLKYEFIYLSKDFTRIYITYGASVAIFSLLLLINQGTGSVVSSALVTLLAIFGIVYYIFTALLAFMTISHNVRRFKKNMFSHEGYLTNTLPVTPAQHVIAKVIAGAVNYVLSFVVIYVGLLVISICTGHADSIRNMMDIFFEALDNFGLILPLFLSLATGFLAVLLCCYLVTALGSMQGGSKGGSTVLAVLIIIGYMLLYSTISSALYSNGVSTEGVMYFFAFFFAACAGIEFALVIHIIKNDLNLQ
ncbi:MAG: hypothetical protein II574_04360 [Ruminococcus sp.]|nr:hypothetical protein [Ruminococcus sp.]